MAELGNLLSSAASGQQEIKVEVEMMDYDFIAQCNDWKQINAILEALKSGKEGYYPDLISFAERKLVELLPAKEKKRYQSLSHKVTPAEAQEAEADVQRWMNSVASIDAKLSTKGAFHSKTLPAVRGSTNKNEITNGKEGSASGCAAAGASGDSLLREVRSSRSASSSADSNNEPEALAERTLFTGVVAQEQSRNQLQKLEKLRLELEIDCIPMLQRRHKASQEKVKGNESFRVAENDIAVHCYNRSLAYDSSNAVVWSNRAMAYIRMELFDLAEADCSVALQLDSGYTKAYSRRGLVRFKRGKYNQAAQDFEAALKLQPDNAELKTLHRNAVEKHREVTGDGVEEDDDDDDVDDVEEVPIQQVAPATVTGTAPMNSSRATYGYDAGKNTGKNTDSSAAFYKTPVRVVESLTDLIFPSHTQPDELSNCCIESGPLVHISANADTDAVTSTAAQQQEQSFVRIDIVSDDDDDDDDDGDDNDDGEGHGAGCVDETPPQQAFHRIAIVDDDEDDEDDEDDDNDDADLPPAPPSALQLAEERKEAGNMLLKEGKLEAAISAYSESLGHDPLYLPALNNRAQAHLMSKDYAAAIKDCAVVLRTEPGNLKALYRRGAAFLALGDAAAAELDVKAILQRDPTNAQAAKLKQKIGAGSSSTAADRLDVEKMKAAAQSYLAQNLPGKVVTLLGWVLRSAAGAHDRADTELFASLLPKDQTSLLHLLSAAYMAIGEYEHAIYGYDALLRIDGSNFRALLKRADAALRHVSKSLETSVESTTQKLLTEALAGAQRDIAAVLKVEPSNSEAIALQQKCISLRSNSPDHGSTKDSESHSAATGTGETVTTDQVAAGAESQGSESQEKQSDEWKDKGNAAMGAKDYSEALSCYTKAIQLHKGNVAAHNNRALVFLKLLQFDRAEADASFVLSNDTCDTDVAAVTARRKKALCRRAQARRALGQNLLQQQHNQDPNVASSGIKTFSVSNKANCVAAEAVLKAAVADLQDLLLIDPENKVAVSEMKAVNNWLQLCNKAKDAVKSGAGTKQKPTAPATTTASRHKQSASIVSPQQHAMSSGAASFDQLGMVARSVKKYNTPDTATSAPTTATATEEEKRDNTEEPTQSSSSSSNHAPSVASPSSDRNAAGSGAAITVTPTNSRSNINSNSSSKSSSKTSQSPQVALNAVPDEPPKTVYELERVWRALKTRPQLFAEYICSFKKTTFKKVFKETVSPDLTSYMLSALHDHASPQNQLKALLGYASIPNFALQFSLLPECDTGLIKSMLSSSIGTFMNNQQATPKQKKTAAQYEEACSLYGIRS